MSKTVEMKKAEKLPSLDDVLAFSKRNAQQLCSILPAEVVLKRRITEWSKQLEAKRQRLAAAEKNLVIREQNVILKEQRLRVESKELQVKEVKLDRQLQKENEFRRNIARQFLNAAKSILMISDPKSGEEQSFNMRLEKRWKEVESKTGIA